VLIEIKRDWASDSLVRQSQRYMDFFASDLAEAGQSVRGVIIALEDDVRIRRAPAVRSNFAFYRYEVTFMLRKVQARANTCPPLGEPGSVTHEQSGADFFAERTILDQPEGQGDQKYTATG
jgi:hypothetical protein